MEKTDGTITITKDDLETQTEQLTPIELHVKNLSSEAGMIARKKLDEAKNLEEFLKWQRTCLWSGEKYIGWLIDQNPEITAGEIVDESIPSAPAQEAKIVEELKWKINNKPGHEDEVKIALRRVRDKSGNHWTYRVLASFPQNTQVEDPILGNVPSQQTRPTIYFQPETACVNHACDDLYKEIREIGSVAFAPNFSIINATEALNVSPGEIAEYVISKNDNIKRDNKIQILVGLLGGYSNETLRVRVSDFWEKHMALDKP